MNKLQININDSRKLRFSGKSLTDNKFLSIAALASETVLAGTSSSGLILSGKIITETANPDTTFSSLGSKSLGNINVMNKISDGTVLYGTTSGYVVNHIAGTSVQVSNYSITALYGTESYYIQAGDSNGAIFISSNSGASWSTGDYPVSGEELIEIFQFAFQIG